MENIIKSGPIYKFHKSVIGRKSDAWKKCDAKLVEAEDNGILVIECPTEKQSQNISLRNCTRVLEAGTRNSRENVLELLLEKKVVQLGFDSRKEAQEWQHLLSKYSKDCMSSQNSASCASNVTSWKPSPAPRTVVTAPQSDTAESMEYNIAYELDSKIPPLDVTLKSSPLAEKLNLRGKFFLIIESDKLTIYSAENRSISYSWEYKTIRKYGRDKKSFSMEVGRRSPHGPGVLVFNTVYGNDIFHRVQQNTVAINSRPQVAATVAPSPTETQARSGTRQESPKLARSRFNADSVNGTQKQAGVPSHSNLSRATSVPVESEYSTIEDPRHANAVRGKRPSKAAAPEIEYCKAEELKGDAWKQHGRMEPNIHDEIYIRGHPETKPKPAAQPKSQLRNNSASHIYGQVNRRSKKSPPPQTISEDSGVYSSLDQGYTNPHHRTPQHPQHPSYDQDNTYDHLSRPTSSPAKLASSQTSHFMSNGEPVQGIDEGNEYDHLQRKLVSQNKPADRQGDEGVYNVLERPGSKPDSREVLFDLVDDGSGYMTNAQAKAIIPPENEYDLAELPAYK